MSQLKSTLLTFLILLVTNLNQVCKSHNSRNTFHPEENPRTDNFEGDIIISDEEEEILENGVNGVAGAGIVGDHLRWFHHTIPYKISSKFSNNDVKIIHGAMKEIEEKTCIRFIKRKDEKDYVFILDGSGCSSNVGRTGKGRQIISLDIGGCVHHGIVIHELVHAIGFWHEQSRTDRDKFIQVKNANIQPENLHNFEKHTSKKLNDFGLPYDYNSVMHYSETAFISDEARKKHGKTIIPRNPLVDIGQRRQLSLLDAKKINRMYCPKRNVPMTSSGLLNKIKNSYNTAMSRIFKL